MLQVITYWIWELVKLNLFWLIYILRGAIIFGLFPATAALYAIARLWIKGEAKTVQTADYTRYFRENFRSSNVIGWITSFMTYMIYLNFSIAPMLPSSGLKMLLYGILVFFAIVIGCLWIYMFPVLVTYELPWYNYFVVSIYEGLTKISYTILQIALSSLYLLFVIHFFPLIIFFGISVLALMQMYIYIYLTEQ